MKFTCNQQSLSKALTTVSKAVSTRTTIPILKGILLKVNSDGTLTLSASDLDLSIEKTIDVNEHKEGSIVVLSKLFGDIIRKLPNEEILIEEKENNNILIKTSTTEFVIVGLPADEFPKIGQINEELNTLSFEQVILKDMIKKTSFAASIDESKGIIVGVLLEIEPDGLNMIALDGFRMAVTRKQMKNKEKMNIIISAKILTEINKIISESNENSIVKLMVSNKKAILLIEGTKVVMRLLEGEFIKYKDILPKQEQIKILINKATLLNSIERASLLAKEGKNNLIKFTVKNNLLTITSRSEEGNVKEEVIMEKQGDDIEIGFNSKYVIDVLKIIDDEEVIMEFNTNTTPCLVKPISGNAFEYLILPVRISSAQ
ncbi:MAG: DNA polymerase III subunit beta [Anaerovoracaceae bacterium]